MLTLLASIRKAMIMILFVIALGTITVNLVVTLVDVFLRLLDRPREIRVFFGGSMDVSKGKYDLLDDLYFLSYLASFFAAWAATTAMLSYYVKRVGQFWFWLITISPIVFFLAQFATLLTPALSTLIALDRFSAAALGTLIGTIAKPVSGLMLAISFWVMARTVGRGNPLRIYLIISGSGLFLLFATNQAILLSIAPYPPFGLASVTLTGVSAYLAIVGIYVSSVTLSNDAKLRKSIRSVAKTEASLLDSISSAEMQKAMENKVMKLVKSQSAELHEKTGAAPSMTEDEITDYLAEVMKEIANKK
jgi:hypothetical protein